MGERDPFDFEGEDDAEKELEDVVKERNRVGKALRDARAEIDRLKPFETQVQTQERDKSLTALFTAAGVDPKRVRYFSAINPDLNPETVTKEQVQTFAREEGFEVKEEGEGSGPTEGSAEGQDSSPATGEESPKEGFKPVTTPTPSGGATGLMERDEFLKLTARDPAAAQEAWESGKVDMASVRQGLGPDK